MNRTSTTSVGFTQCAGSAVLNASSNGLLRSVSRASQQPRDAIEFLLIESRADRAGPPQRAAVVVVADEQRSEVLARLARLGPAADDELLLLEELHLAPRRRALAAVIRATARP